MGIEIQILDWIQNIRTPFLDMVVPFITQLGNAGIIWILTAVVLLLIPSRRRSGIIMAVALIADLVLCNLVLKNLVARIRPYDINTAVSILIAKPLDYSFPSGHTAASFASVSALFFAKEKKLWKIALVPAVLIAFTRLYLYVHYPTDILGGMVVGIVSGYIGLIIFQKNKRMLMRVMGICLIIIMLIFAYKMSSDSDADSGKSLSFFAMDTYMSLTVYGNDADKVIEEAKNLAEYYESLFSVNIDTSDVARLNSSQGQPVRVSEDTYELIEKSVEYSELSGGLFDITIYPVVKEWGFTTKEYNIPSDEMRGELLERIGYEKIHLMPDYTIMLDAGCEIDLGGIAKGFLSQKIIEVFKENNVPAAIVSLGGNVQTYGQKPDKTDYLVGISNPFKKDDTIGTVSVKEKSVVTSGSYQRYFEKNEKVYHHIMDTRTAAPAESGLVSVTVIADDGTYADAMSTALYIMGEDGAKEYQKSHPDIDIILINTLGEIWVSEGVVSDDLV